MKWVCAFLPLLLSACTSWQNIPDDVRFVALHSETGPDQTSKRGETIDVEFETDFNYINHVDGFAGVNVDFYFCDQESRYVQGLGGLGLYKYTDKWTRVERAIHDDSPPPYRYHSAFFAAIHDKTAMLDAKITILDYDLHETPRDLCARFNALLGLGLTGWAHEKSNIVRIPKEELIKFFGGHPRPQTGMPQ